MRSLQLYMGPYPANATRDHEFIFASNWSPKLRDMFVVGQGKRARFCPCNLTRSKTLNLIDVINKYKDETFVCAVKHATACTNWYRLNRVHNISYVFCFALFLKFGLSENFGTGFLIAVGWATVISSLPWIFYRGVIASIFFLGFCEAQILSSSDFMMLNLFSRILWGSNFFLGFFWVRHCLG